MKNLFNSLLTIFSIALISCQGNSSSTDRSSNSITEQVINKSLSESPIMTFDKNLHDFGTILEGQTASTVFTFTNTGKSDLIIVDARGSCGCTVPEYPKNIPIAPGKTGQIRVSFDSSNKPNDQQKTVTISANTDSGRETIRIRAMVTPDPAKQKQRDAQQSTPIQQ